jgi:DNA-binding transcriptional regulator YdaS (Cro superfamily)
MKLKTYLTSEGIGVRAFARTCGVSAATIKRVRDSEVVPSRTTMTKIVTATGGLVTVHDLMSAIHDEATEQSKQGRANHGEDAAQ